MKRGKEEEKKMGPMFPRLHVNDTAEKGGPRAPPRNKMALYEQLSIPSQRSGSGLLPLDPRNNKPSTASPASSSQGSGVERSMSFPCQLPLSSPMARSEKFQSGHSNGPSVAGMAGPQLEPRQKMAEETEFVVPVLVARAGKCFGKTQQSADRETVSSTTSARSGQLAERRNPSDQVPKRNDSSIDASFGQAIRKPSKEKNGNRENFEGNVRNFEGYRATNCEGEACLHQESRFGARSAGGEDDLMESRSWDNPRSESHCSESDGRPKKPENGGKHNGNVTTTCISLQLKRVENGDFETSAVDIAPDDVVGIIGQKHFWKARKAIVNQQRLFTAQVIELHKLVKVQRLIAESPHLFLDGAFLGKSSFKSSPGKKIPEEFLVKPRPVVVNCKDDSEKPSDKVECSAENAVVKTSLSPVKNGSQSTNHGPQTGQTQPAVTTTDNKAGPWCFPQPTGPQWLVPVMSPSEGLVYKPYPGPVPGAVYGGFGGFGSAPTTGNYPNSPNGIPASHPQGVAGFPGASPVTHPYFPYGMPVTDHSPIEQVNPIEGPVSHTQTGPVPSTGASLNAEQQSSCNAPATPKSGSISRFSKFRASRGCDVQQGSTASSPSERANGVGINPDSGGRDPLPLFPMAPVASEGASESLAANKPTRVIKVIPHNPRSATESAARIFRFIQEERKQYNFV